MTIKHVWQAEDYHYHSSVQNDAATQLLESMQLEGDEHVIDVGCGDGKVTAMIADRIPTGFVTGIDISSEMVDFASKLFSKNRHPNLAFLQRDAQQFDFHGELDVVFSSFALQWFREPGLFFKSAYTSLKSSGYIAATIPLGISSALERSISIVTSLPRWSAYFQTFSPGWHFISCDKYQQLLAASRFRSLRFVTFPQTIVFSSRDDFEKYIIPWFSYLNPLPKHLKQPFLQQVIDKYLEISPPLWGGEIGFSFSRLDLIAKKVIP